VVDKPPPAAKPTGGGDSGVCHYRMITDVCAMIIPDYTGLSLTWPDYAGSGGHGLDSVVQPVMAEEHLVSHEESR
jgi:hypothetical protein